MSTGVGLTVEIAVAAKMVKLLMYEDCLLDDLMAAHESVGLYVASVLYVVCLSVAFVNCRQTVRDRPIIPIVIMEH